MNLKILLYDFARKFYFILFHLLNYLRLTFIICCSMNEMSLPTMIFRHLLVSSKRRTGIFLEQMTYHMTINFCRVILEILQGD